MARAEQSLGFHVLLALACILCLASCAESRTAAANRRQQKTWCIAKPSTEENKLKDNIEYSCSQSGVDCSVIAANGSCFYPNNIVSHASVVMNLHYRAAGKHTWDCYFNATALIVQNDPSFGHCVYPL
ncbi:PREDICTED: major pollen allergen Ole e 10-like [Nelumbo nucifera]|uniref:Major pollen allergen Ole e 10-like n=1 Tax=Nelumbo nucifera TaxID=4432 RepID=A0A1U8AT02_NELNU|nr:PREDICTED: major pollen allergen Ole e 10-like [Nelumbo nucifera]